MTRVRRTNFKTTRRNLPKSSRSTTSAGSQELATAKGPGGEALSNFSITIRTGRGVDLGSNSSTSLEAWLMQFKQYSFSVEKTGNQAHFQGCIRDVSSVTRLKTELLEIYRETDPEWCTKNDKHAIKVVEHENWHGLLMYTRKEQLAVYSKGVPVKTFSYGFTQTYPHNRWLYDMDLDRYYLTSYDFNGPATVINYKFCDCEEFRYCKCRYENIFSTKFIT